MERSPFRRGASDRNRTNDTGIFSPLLYQLSYRGVWSGLRGSNSLPPPWQGGALPDELKPLMVGMTGFEPAASCSQSRRATELRYIPSWIYLQGTSGPKAPIKRAAAPLAQLSRAAPRRGAAGPLCCASRAPPRCIRRWRRSALPTELRYIPSYERRGGGQGSRPAGRFCYYNRFVPPRQCGGTNFFIFAGRPAFPLPLR